MERINYLFHRYYEQTATDEEVRELMELLKDPSQDAKLSALLEQQWEGLVTADPRFTAAKGLPVLNRALGKEDKVRFLPRLGWVAAAAVILLGGVTAFLWQQPVKKPQQAQVIMPGSNKAMLILADGSSVTLDSAGKQVIKQGNTTIMQSGGQLQYAANGNNSTISYNTLRTPRGGQFRLTLPDGSAVWLNAASSITYPTAFTGADRTVKVTGEAYFEIAKMADKPFRVKISERTTINVLGTNFNINAYTDEPFTNTTLLEGSIGVMTGDNQQVVLRPGQQARTTGTGVKVLDNTDLDQVVAWKNGAFNFDGTDLSSVLRQLSRWYDVEVVFEGKIPQRRFGGAIQRNLQLQQVLRILEKMNIKFRMDGRKLIVEQEQRS
ncbi:FecR family protein [Chitinophaga sp. YR573]|uniref:FecR family protein n=1 Tax=Chitinophaga sp. YR573 TaxID=1881040 RepID=UPI0008BC3E08|nr:FecR family protein [Chitinophaga sp. YR573]SEW39729.1 FecR family protein [Chitinophaga sp. YR573]